MDQLTGQQKMQLWFKISDIETHIKVRYLERLLWNFLKVYATRPHR